MARCAATFLLACLTLLTTVSLAQPQTSYRIDTLVGGFAGDNEPAVAARLRFSTGVAVDGSGSLYIADTDNHRIRKVDSTGTITTIAGTTERVDGGLASLAWLNSPTGVAVDGLKPFFWEYTHGSSDPHLDPHVRTYEAAEEFSLRSTKRPASGKTWSAISCIRFKYFILSSLTYRVNGLDIPEVPILRSLGLVFANSFYLSPSENDVSSFLRD